MKLVTPLRLGLIGTVSLLIGMGLDAIWWKHNPPIPALSDNSGSPGAILVSRVGALLVVASLFWASMAWAIKKIRRLTRSQR